jgi:magnesium-transporting ATPase (P-type)
MIANAVFVATLIFLALGFWLTREMQFLTHWRSLILHQYLKSIALYCALLFANLLGLTIWIERKFFLRDAGRKLTHLDQEIHTGHSALSDEILSQFGDGEKQEISR